MKYIVIPIIVLALLVALGCNLTEPLVALAQPAPSLPPAVQVGRYAAVALMFVAFCWMIVRLVRGK